MIEKERKKMMEQHEKALFRSLLLILIFDLVFAMRSQYDRGILFVPVSLVRPETGESVWFLCSTICIFWLRGWDMKRIIYQIKMLVEDEENCGGRNLYYVHMSIFSLVLKLRKKPPQFSI